MVLFAVALVAAFSGPVLADDDKEFRTDVGRGRVFVPAPTSEGNWDGTWMYKSRDFYLALWARSVDGKPELKLQYMGLATPEAFETDWSGDAVYYVAGEQATFHLAVEEGGADRFRGRWDWDVQFQDSGRTERGSFEGYRSGDGRTLNLEFDKLERIISRLGKEKHLVASPVWSFRKVSRRLIRWDEIPF